MDIGHNFQKLNNSFQQKVGERNILLQKLTTLQAEITNLESESLLLADVRKLFETLVKVSTVKIQDYIEPLVTEALEFVFDYGLNFHLYFTNRRNQVEVDFIILRDVDSEKAYQRYITDVVKYEKQLEQLVKGTKDLNFLYGGAINQVVSLVLRLIIVELLKIQGPLVLDEPSSAVDNDVHSVRLGQLLMSLSKRFGRQIILVTHSKNLSSFADRIYSVEQQNGISNVKLVEER